MNRIKYCDAFLDWREASGGGVEIFNIEVPSGTRRRGYGRHMVDMLLDARPDGTVVWAMTRPSNHIAQQFYEKLRFKVAGYLRGVYDKGAGDAIVYCRVKGDMS